MPKNIGSTAFPRYRLSPTELGFSNAVVNLGAPVTGAAFDLVCPFTVTVWLSYTGGASMTINLNQLDEDGATVIGTNTYGAVLSGGYGIFGPCVGVNAPGNIGGFTKLNTLTLTAAGGNKTAVFAWAIVDPRKF